MNYPPISIEGPDYNTFQLNEYATPLPLIEGKKFWRGFKLDFDDEGKMIQKFLNNETILFLEIVSHRDQYDKKYLIGKFESLNNNHVILKVLFSKIPDFQKKARENKINDWIESNSINSEKYYIFTIKTICQLKQINVELLKEYFPISKSFEKGMILYRGSTQDSEIKSRPYFFSFSSEETFLADFLIEYKLKKDINVFDFSELLFPKSKQSKSQSLIQNRDKLKMFLSGTNETSIKQEFLSEIQKKFSTQLYISDFDAYILYLLDQNEFDGWTMFDFHALTEEEELSGFVTPTLELLILKPLDKIQKIKTSNKNIFSISSKIQTIGDNLFHLGKSISPFETNLYIQRSKKNPNKAFILQNQIKRCRHKQNFESLMNYLCSKNIDEPICRFCQK